MKWMIHVALVFMNLFEAHCVFLSLLNQLDMKNPIIIGEINNLRTKEMFTLMKNVMNLNQTICLSTSFRNDSLQPSPGIVIQPTKHTLAKYFGQNHGKRKHNDGLYVLTHKTVFENQNRNSSYLAMFIS